MSTSQRLIAMVLLSVLAGTAWAQSPTEGKAVYERWCAGCHDPTEGRDRAGTYILRLRYKGALPAAIEQRTDLTPEYIKALVRGGRNFMPRTRKTEISDAQLDALASYLGKARSAGATPASQ